MQEIILEGDITLSNAFDIKENLYNIILQDNEGIIINFRNVTFIDSTGLGILVSVLKKCQEKRKELRLINLNNKVKDIFAMTMLDTIFNIR